MSSPLLLLSRKSFRTFMEKRPYPRSKFSTFIQFTTKNLAPLIWPKYNSHPCFSVYGKNTHTPHLHSTLRRGLNIITHLPSPRDRFPWSRTSSSLHPWAGSWRRGCCSRRSMSRRRPACRGAWRWSRREGKGSTSRWRRTRGSPSRRRWTVSTLRGPWRSPLLLSMK